MKTENNKIIVPIKGMHCKSCEILIEEKLKEVEGVSKVEVDHKQAKAEVHFRDNKPDEKMIEEAIASAGYQVGEAGPDELIIKDKKAYWDLGIAFLILVSIYYVGKALGFGSLAGAATSGSSSLPVVILVGLTAGFSTCMALVGGLVLGASARHAELHPEATWSQKFRPHLYFNLGRIMSFFLLGGILGAIGSFFQLSSLALGILTLAIGIVMLIMGLQLINIFPWLEKWKLTLPKGISNALGLAKHQKEYSHTGSMILGAGTFFLPCGFTQAMQILAMGSGSFMRGALIMSFFALGTAPGLLGIGGLTSIVKGKMTGKFFKAAGLAVIFFALFNISNGYRLTGWNISWAAGNNSIQLNDPNVILQNGVQIVRMAQTGRGYSPSSFTIKKGVPVKWIVDSQNAYTCDSVIVVPALNIRKNLVAGENTIEFTPSQVGKITFSCSMGMYSGQFIVTDGSGATAPSAPSVATRGSSCGGSGGGCGGCGGGAPKPAVQAPPAQVADDVQIINAGFTYNNDIQPNTFTVKVGKPVRFVVNPTENGAGCMSTIMIPGLYNNPVQIRAGQQIVMEFTPDKPGQYQITCAMGVPRGTISVQ
ncbi:MAG: sulfite exporter TauE/SafE family protein [Patescibacteria group bacterium]